MSHHTHEHHNLDNEENFKRIVAALDSEKRKQQLSAEAIIGMHANGGHRIPSHVMKESLEKLQLPIIQQLVPAEGMYLFIVGKK